MSGEQEYVYAIAHPHGYVKLGRSKHPQKRLKQHQTGCPYELWILMQMPVDNPKKTEATLHEYFKERHTRGEWFEMGYGDYDDLGDMIRMASSAYNFESVDEFKQWQAKKREAVF